MSSGSMRETIKALNTAFSAPTVPSPLPDELRDTIESFLERYDNIDDHDSQRFHEDLHALYQRYVAQTPEKHGAFLSLLCLVQPALTGEARLSTWWNLVVKRTVDGIGYKRQEIKEARDFVQSILVYDAEADRDGEHARLSRIFSKKLLDLYLARTNVPFSAEGAVSPENDSIAHELECLLVAYGRKMPKALLLALDDLFVQQRYRIQALNLLSAFVRLQPPHLHLVLETPLIQHLEKCLLTDASSTVIELALVVLIMFLPHICGALSSDHHLAKMFLIYSRLLCWDRLGNNDGSSPTEERADEGDKDSEEDDDGDDGESELSWEPVQHSLDSSDSSLPTLMHYFTFLYGLFPLNFMSFIRKPRRFLKSLNFPGARDFDLDQDLIHSRTEPYRRVHLLHPSMFTTTVEEELSENRWLKSDPADVVTDCMDLCMAASSTLADPGPPPSAALPAIPIPPILQDSTRYILDDDATTNNSDASWRNTQSTMFASPNDAPETFEIPPKAKSLKSLKSVESASHLLKSHETVRPPDSPTLPPAKEKETPPSSLAGQQASLHGFAHSVIAPHLDMATDFQAHTMASLQREIMLLRNDLNFERYLKLQHLAHIGQLQRKHIKEATADAETQNLINSNKMLKARLAKANELYAQLKKETLTSRNQSKKWETELSSKLRGYRDSEKTWTSEEDTLRYNLQRTQSDYEHLKQIVEKAEAEQLKARQRIRAPEHELENYGNVRRELEAAQEKIMTLEDQRRDVHALIQERNDLHNDLEIANMRLNSREVERSRSIQAYERRIMELETRLQMGERTTTKPGQLPSSVQQMLDSALAASSAKLQQMKKAHHHLIEQHTELQMKFHDLDGERQADRGRLHMHERSDIDPSHLSRNSSMAMRHDNRYLPPLATEVTPDEDRETYLDYHSPTTLSPARPVRSDSSFQKPQRAQITPSPYPNFGGSFGPDFAQTQDNGRKQADSTYSVDTEGSAKVVPKSEVRIYGRGGAQNIGKKKDKDKAKEGKKGGSSKTGGFRGLKGIM